MATAGIELVTVPLQSQVGRQVVEAATRVEDVPTTLKMLEVRIGHEVTVADDAPAIEANVVVPPGPDKQSGPVVREGPRNQRSRARANAPIDCSMAMNSPRWGP